MVGAALGCFLGTLTVLSVPAAGLALCGSLALVSFLAATRRRTRSMLAAALVLVLIGTTKFRTRSADALVAGDVDAQILFELACFAAVGLLTLRLSRSAWELQPRVTAIELLLGLYVALALSSAMWSPAPSLTAVTSIQLGTVLALAIVSVRMLGPTDSLRLMLGTLLFYLFAGSLATVVLVAAGQQEANLRFGLFRLHPGRTGDLAAIGSLAMIAAWMSRARLGRLTSGASAPLIASLACVILIATIARVAIASYALVLVTCVVLSLRDRRMRTATTLAILAVTAVLALVLPPAEELVRAGGAVANPITAFIYRGESTEAIVSISGRTELWTRVASLVTDAPILGHGFVSSRAGLYGVHWARYAHSAYLQLPFDLGAVGTLIVGAVLLSTLVRGIAIGAEPSGRERGGLVVFALTLFLLLVATTGESFSGAPSPETLCLFLCALTGERLASARVA